MAFSEFELFKIEKALAAFQARHGDVTGPSQVLYRMDGHAIEVYLQHPSYRDPAKLVQTSICKLTWVGTQKVWRLAWLRASLKWCRYEPMPTARDIEAALAAVSADPYGCFFG